MITYISDQVLRRHNWSYLQTLDFRRLKWCKLYIWLLFSELPWPSNLQRWWWTIETWISCKQIGHKQFSFSNYRKCELDEIRESQIWLNFLSWARNGYQAAWHLTILLQNRHLEWTPSSCYKILGVKNLALEICEVGPIILI